MSALKGLSNWWKDRSNRVGVPQTPSRSRQGKRWSLWKVPTEDVARLKELSASAARLEALMQQPVWTEIVEAKLFYQDNARGRILSLATDDRTRRDAVVEHQALEGFFAELKLRVKRGKEAEEELRKLGESY